MSDENGAGQVLRMLWERIDAQDWDGMARLLDPALRVRYVHTGEILTAAELVRLNREYPGTWRATLEDLVVEGERAVSRAVVTDGTETYHVASFATVAAGRITELVEVWADGASEPAADRRPSRPA